VNASNGEVVNTPPKSKITAFVANSAILVVFMPDKLTRRLACGIGEGQSEASQS
jgi:hypothetical protein